MLLAVSDINPHKLEIASSKNSNYFNLEQISSTWKKDLTLQLDLPKDSGVTVVETSRGVIFEFDNKYSFKKNESELNSSLKIFLDSIVSNLKHLKLIDMYISISGNSSFDEDDKWILSAKRAINIGKFLSENGVSSYNIKTVANSDNYPSSINNYNQTGDEIVKNQRKVSIEVYRP